MGNTLRSPSFVDFNDGETAVEDQMQAHYAGQLSFPYARPEDWYTEKARKGPHSVWGNILNHNLSNPGPEEDKCC